MHFATIKNWQDIYLQAGIIFRYDIYLLIIYLLRYKVYHCQASLSDKEWAVGLDVNKPPFCEYISLVISIGHDILARW